MPSESAIHVEYNSSLNPNLQHYQIHLSRDRYLALVNFVTKSFKLKDGKIDKIDQFSYFDRDSFFWGVESYHLFNTCNMWTARGLESAGIDHPLWSPFRFGINRALLQYAL